MPLYKKMYFHLFNAITDALKKLDEQDIPKAQMGRRLLHRGGRKYRYLKCPRIGSVNRYGARALFIFILAEPLSPLISY